MMREFIDLIEGAPPGNLYSSDDGEAVGYWYHPRSGEHYVIAWEMADGIETFTDHCDVAIDHPEWFGLDPDTVYDDCDTVRTDVIFNGWVRIGYNTSHHMMWMDAASPQALHRGYKWFIGAYPHVEKISLGLIAASGWTSYVVNRDDLLDYEKSGRLLPSWRV